MARKVPPAVALHRARVASLSAHEPNSHEKITDARRSLAEANLAAYIEKTLAAAPPLTDEQVARLAGLLGGGLR